MSSTRYVALLRAVNVGGTGRLPMAELRQICLDSGWTDVATYIQSGNVVLSSDLDEAGLRKAMAGAIADRAGFTPDVMIRTAAEMEEVVASLPYPRADPKHVHVGFLHEPPTPDQVAAVAGIQMPPESATVVGRQVYLLLPDGIGRSKLPAAVSRGVGGVSTTVRNWRTVTTLRDMAAGID